MVDDKDALVCLNWQTAGQLASVFSIRIFLLFPSDVSHSDCCQARFNYVREEKGELNECKARLLINPEKSDQNVFCGN